MISADHVRPYAKDPAFCAYAWKYVRLLSCTCRQDILAGDDEEHAILLHNFILHLIMLKEGNAGANRRPPGRTGLRTEVGGTLYIASGGEKMDTHGNGSSRRQWGGQGHNLG